MTFAERMKQADGGTYYPTTRFGEWLSIVLEDYKEIGFPKSKAKTNKKTGEKKVYLELPCAFDIETTNFTTDSGDELATMYIWMFGIGGAVLVGRTWTEFRIAIRMVADAFGLGQSDRRLICGVHNLSFEFQFIRGLFRWTHIFARATREPLYAVCEYGIEFRDTLALTNESLARVGSHLSKYPVRKRVGDLDYKLLRNQYTEMTPEEMGYCINDVLVVMSLLQERMESDGGIENIPLTQTGYPRRFCRNKCMPSSRKWPYYDYKKIMDRLTMEPEEYVMVRKAFQGGFTHSNPWYVGKTLENVTSYDFTSSYPAVLCFEKYPMSKGQRINPSKITPAKFNELLKKYGSVMTLTFIGLESKTTNEFYLSSYKCEKESNVVSSNGRIVSADMITTTMTNVDFEIVKQTYNFKSVKVHSMYVYRMDYLPKPFIQTVLELYTDKTTLKDTDKLAPDEETARNIKEDYQRKKEILNALYGMSATDVCRPSIGYADDEWTETEPNVKDSIDEYNNDENRFLSYIWGCFCTSFARKNLWSGIIECGVDYVYSDTDSIKILNAERHLDYINRYNDEIQTKALLMCHYRDIKYALCVPKTVYGESKPLGYWDYDGFYSRFRTLGAKRYMVEKDGKLSLTVSGVNKYVAVPYLISKYGDSVFEHFDDGLYFPKGHSGKTIVKYIDEPFTEELTDYQGNKATVSETACVHIEDGDYTLGISGMFKEFIRQLTTGFVELGQQYRQ